MALVVAIIIIIVLAIKGFSDKSYTNHIRRETQSRIQDSTEIKRAFIAKYVDKRLEDTILSDGAEVEEMRNLIKEEVGINPSITMVKVALMAKRGKIPSEYANVGIGNQIYWGGKHSKAKTYTESQDLRNEQFKFIKWYNKYLIKNGMDDDQLYYMSNESCEAPNHISKDNATPVMYMSNARNGGFYFWNGTQPIYKAITHL